MARKPRLLWFALVSTVPVAALLFVIVAFTADHFIKAAVTSEIKHRLSVEAEAAAHQIDSKLINLTSTLYALADNEFVVTGLVDNDVLALTVQPFFKHLTIPGARQAQILFTDYRGRMVASTIRIPPKFESDSWHGTVMAGRRYLEIDQDGMTAVVPVFYQGRPEGAIVATFDAAQVRDFLMLGSNADTVTVYLNDRFITSTNKDFAVSQGAGETNGQWITSVVNSDVYPSLRIELSTPVRAAFATVSDVNRLLILAMGSAMVILVVALVLVALTITRPLAKLVGDLRQFNSANDLSRRVTASNIAEFAEVADAFNLMFDRLKKVLVSHEHLETENRQRRIAEQAVRDKESETQAIVDHVLDGIITISSSGIIRTVNPAAKQIFGFSAEEMVGQNLRMLMPDPYRSKHDSYIQNYLNTGEAKIIGIGREVTGQRKNGDVFPMELGIAAMTIHGERQFTGMVRDITERKRIDQMKSEFVSVVSHELRTPLTSLSGSLGLVSAGALGTLPDKAQSLLSVASSNAKRLICLVNDILDVEKIEAGKIDLDVEPLNPVTVVENVIAENEAYGMKYGVTYTLHEDLDGAFVEADEQRLMQVLANLLSNAAKFSRDGTGVDVSLSRHGSDIRFAIKDSGVGISEADMDKLFKKFSQIDSSDSRSKHGTGLGLNISQGIVQLHGGKIQVQSTVGEGSTFFFDLKESPAAASDAPSTDDEPLIAATG